MSGSLGRVIVPLLLVFLGFRVHPMLGYAILVLYAGLLIWLAKTSYYTYRGNTCYQRGDFQQAMVWFDKATDRPSCKPTHLIGYAFLLMKNGYTDKAEELLDRALKRDLSREDRLNAETNVSLLLWRKGKLDEAVEKLEAIVEQYKTINVYSSLGYFYILQGKLDRALEFNLEAYDYDNANPVILDNLGQTYLMRGEMDEAEPIYVKLRELKPTFPEAYYNYGLVLEARGRDSEALELMRESLNHPLSFLSTVSRDEIESHIAKVEARLSGVRPELPEGEAAVEEDIE